MTAVYADSTKLNSTWKEVYAPKINDLMPDGAVFYKEVPFEEADKLGDKFIEPVCVGLPQGCTYLGQNSSVATLKDARAGNYQEAQIDGFGFVARDQISYNVASKMANSNASFVKWGNLIAPNLKKTTIKRFEISALWGQSTAGIGVIESVTYAGVHATTGSFVITAATWSPGIWGGMEGATLDVLASGLATQVNSTQPYVVTGVDFDTRTISISGFDDDLAALVALTAASPVVFFEGAVTAGGTPTWAEQVGLYKQVTNTASTIWNIAAGTYSIWKGNAHALGSTAMTMAKALHGIGKPSSRGLESDIDLFLSVATFNNLNADQAALRVYDSSYRKDEAESGFNRIVYHGPNGRIAVRPHLYMMEGYGLGVPMSSLKRIGSSDITFQLPGKPDGEIFLHIPDKSGYEIRNWTEQAIYTNQPCWGIGFSGIVNTTP
jgi:hypothetical protein